MKKTGENRVDRLMGICFLAVGLLCVAACVVTTALSLRFRNNADKVHGIIVDPASVADAQTGSGGGTLVMYAIDGENYLKYLSESNSSWRCGDRISLYVDKRDRGHVRSASLLYLPAYITGGLSIPFLGVGIGFSLAVSSKKKRKKRLLAEGRKIWAEVTGGEVDYHYQVGTRNPYRLECRYTDPYSGSVYLCRSGHIWEDPNFYIGQQVAVYVDKDKPKNYYVDLESLPAPDLEADVKVYDYR